MQVAILCMNSEELRCVYDDMRMTLDQAPHDMYTVHGSE